MIFCICCKQNTSYWHFPSKVALKCLSLRFNYFVWIIVYNTAKFYVKSQTTVIHMNFSGDARFDKVLPRSDEYYIDSLILPSVILCTLEFNAREPLCVGVLYNSNSTTCKLLKFYLTQINVFRQEYGDYWKYYLMKLGGNYIAVVRCFIWWTIFDHFKLVNYILHNNLESKTRQIHPTDNM